MKHLINLITLLLFSAILHAQVGINNTDPKASLDISASNQANPSNTDGLLIPRIDDFPASDPTSAQQGMMVYLTTTSGGNPPGFYYWDDGGSSWASVIGVEVQKLDDLNDGKSDNNGSSVFLGVNAGTNDDSTNNKNVGIGFEALKLNTSGYFNTANGYQSLSNNTTGYNNTATGLNSLFSNTTGSSNTANGYYSLNSNTTGTQNTAVGTASLSSNTTGYSNIAIGQASLFSNTIGSANTAIGVNSLVFNTTGRYNTSLGVNALRLNTTGEDNTAIGAYSLYSNTTGTYNNALGKSALYSNTIGNNNTALGNGSGGSNITGSTNVFIGYQSGFNELGSNTLYIENSNANPSNALIYGEFDNNILRVNGELQIGGPAGISFAFPTVDGTANQVMQTNGSGNISWISPSSGTDNQTVDQFALSGTTLGISLEDDGAAPYTVDLSSLVGDDDWTDVSADIERQTGNVYIGDVNTTDNDLYISDRIIDWDDTTYYLDPDNISKVDEIEFDSGSVSDPSIRFSDVDTGFYSPTNATTAYSTNGAEIFRISNSGSIGIGTTTPISNYNLTSSSYFNTALVHIGPQSIGDPVISLSSSSGSNIEGVVATLSSSSSTTDKKGFYSSLSGVGLSSTLGFFRGSASSLSGVRNDVTLGSYEFTGLSNYISGTIPPPSSGDSMGIYNYLTASGTGNFMGMHNRFNGASTGINKGIFNYFTPNSQGIQYGVHTVINSSNSSNKYGTYIDIPNTAGGTHYGVYSDVDNTTTGYAGYYLGRVSFGTTTVNNYIFPSSRGTNGQVIQTDGSGNLSWVTPTTGTDNQNISGSGLSGTDLTIGIENGTSQVIDLSSLQDGTGTDDQDITSATLTGTTLAIAIENGTGTSVDLSPLQDADWYETGGTPPNSISDNIYTSGKVGINTTSPDTRLHLKHVNNFSTGGFKLENTSANYWRLYVSSGATGDFRFYSSVNSNALTAKIDGASGSYTAVSDRRLKKDFNNLYFQWEEFMKLEPLTYRFKIQKNEKKYIGLVAQDVKEIYPELVSYTEEEDVYQLDYSATGIVAIKAVQELKKEVEILSLENKKLKQKLSKYEQLEARLSALENKSNLSATDLVVIEE